MGSRRLVIVDPSWSSRVGHHGDLNDALRTALTEAGWWPEVWTDAALEASPGVRPVFRDCGYEDPRHWADVAGTLHLARRLEAQLQSGTARDPVAAWVVHTALPFQLLGLARWLQRQPAAAVAVSLMFPPGETMEGPPGDPQATAPGSGCPRRSGEPCSPRCWQRPDCRRERCIRRWWGPAAIPFSGGPNWHPPCCCTGAT
jgi:hypothetical protein